MITTVQKCLYRYAYSFSRKCQKQNFFLYLKKYITKHIKYREKKDDREYEYDVLKILTDNECCEDVIYNLNTEKLKLCKFLYDCNLDIYMNRKKDYSFRVLTDEQHVNKLSNEYKSISKIDDSEIIENIVKFSVKFQHVFVKSDLTAKTKIQEHWFMRMPIYATCITIIYGFNVFDTNNKNYTKLIFMNIAYVLSLYLVAIRFHQSVSAETKKFSSELYSKEKNDLFVNLINKLKQ